MADNNKPTPTADKPATDKPGTDKPAVTSPGGTMSPGAHPEQKADAAGGQAKSWPKTDKPAAKV